MWGIQGQVGMIWELHLNDSPIEKVNCFKYLGIWLSSELSWSKHIDYICAKPRHLLEELVLSLFVLHCTIPSQSQVISQNPTNLQTYTWFLLLPCWLFIFLSCERQPSPLVFWQQTAASKTNYAFRSFFYSSAR